MVSSVLWTLHQFESDLTAQHEAWMKHQSKSGVDNVNG